MESWIQEVNQKVFLFIDILKSKTLDFAIENYFHFRFSHIIAAQFVGHTHYDEMNLYFDDNKIDEPISVVYNGGSFTTFINVNPNYVIYEINPKTMVRTLNTILNREMIVTSNFCF